MEDDVLYMEVEDIMCDQGIISAELNVDFQSKSSTIALSAAWVFTILLVLFFRKWHA